MLLQLDGELDTVLTSTPATVEMHWARLVSPLAQVSYQPCPLGAFDPLSPSLQCQKCPPGKFTDTLAALDCRSCPAGRFASSAGLSACAQCPAGSVSAVDGSPQCELCIGSQYQQNPGQSKCLSCGSGQYVLGSGGVVSGCEPCPPFATCSELGIFAQAGFWLLRAQDTGLVESFPCLAGLCLAGSACVVGNATAISIFNSSLGVGSCCATNRLTASDNVLCGRCQAGFVDSGGACVCTPLFSCIAHQSSPCGRLSSPKRRRCVWSRGAELAVHDSVASVCTIQKHHDRYKST